MGTCGYVLVTISLGLAAVNWGGGGQGRAHISSLFLAVFMLHGGIYRLDKLVLPLCSKKKKKKLLKIF